MEWFCPPLRNPILNLILHGDFVGWPGKGLREGLFVQLIKFIVELCDHLLNARCFLLLVKFVVDCILNVLICIVALGFLSWIRLIFQHLWYLGSSIFLQQRQVLFVDLVQIVRVYIEIRIWNTDLLLNHNGLGQGRLQRLGLSELVAAVDGDRNTLLCFSLLFILVSSLLCCCDEFGACWLQIRLNSKNTIGDYSSVLLLKQVGGSMCSVVGVKHVFLQWLVHEIAYVGLIQSSTSIELRVLHHHVALTRKSLFVTLDHVDVLA